MVMVSLHSLGSLAKGVAYFNFEAIGNIAIKQLPVIDDALDLLSHELVDVADIIIRLQLNLWKLLKLQENVGVHSSSCKNLDEILRSFYDMPQRLQQVYPGLVFDFVQGIDAYRRPGIYIRELDEELLAICKAQSGRRLSRFFSVLVDINGRLQELSGLSLSKLLDERVQNALGISAVFLGPIAVEVCQFLGCRIGKEIIDDSRCDVCFAGSS